MVPIPWLPLLLLFTALPTTVAANPHSPRIHGWLLNAVKQSLLQVEQNACGSEQKHPCSGRDLSNAAVSTYLVSSLATNGTDINTTGAMHWLSQVQPGGSFVGQGFCALAQEDAFMASVNTTSAQWIVASINKALPGLAVWSSIDVSYSNMYFMGMVNCIICGEAPGVNRTLGQAAATHGYTLFNNWLIYAATAGNHEFDSPTYYWVQMNALGLGCMYAKNDVQRQKICRVLEHLWADVAVNFFHPTETLSGPHSRDYDFLYGHGALQVLTYINGLGRNPPLCEYNDAHCERTNDGQNALVLLNALRARDPSSARPGHRPKASTLALANVSTRVVQSRWLGQNLTKNNMTARFGDRYNYIRSNLFAIGSASQDYITNTHRAYYPCPQDKLINIDLAFTNGMTQYKPIPDITLVHDWMDQPYGHRWGNNPTDKPSHLAPHPGNVQFENILLATSALNPTEALDGFHIDGFTHLASNVLLPSGIRAKNVSLKPNASISYYVLNDHNISVPPTSVYERELPINATMGIQVNRACLAIRVLACDGVGGYLPKVLIKADAFGLSLGAFRLVLSHYVGTNSTLNTTTHVANAFLMVVDECGGGPGGMGLKALVNEVAKANVVSVRDGRHWSITTIVRGHEMAVQRDVSEPHCSAWECVMSRKINGTDVVPVPLSLNGAVIEPLPVPN